MNINKFKNLLIIFLTILNGCLLFLNISEGMKYVLSPKQESAIRNLLAQNNISLPELIVKDFSPKRGISITSIPINHEGVIDIFFSPDENPSKTIEFKETVYSSGSKTLYLADNYVFFEDLDADRLGYLDMSLDEKTKICEEYIRKISSLYKSMDFRLDRKYEDGNESVIEYRSKLDGHVIYSNFIRFRFSNLGIIQIGFSYSEINGFSGEKKDIYSIDEILLTLMYELKNIYGDQPVVIENIDIVYRIIPSVNIGEQQNASPYYRVYIKQQPDPLLIDAYLNRLDY